MILIKSYNLLLSLLAPYIMIIINYYNFKCTRNSLQSNSNENKMAITLLGYYK